MQVSITPVADERGWFTHWVSIQRDITERRQREDRVRATVAGASGLVLVVDDSGALRTVSPSVDRLLGWPPDELAGVPLADLVHPDDQPAVLLALGGAEATQTGALEARLLHRDGDWRWLEMTAARQDDRAWGTVVVVTAADVTERKTGQRRFRSAFDDAPIGMAICALDGALLQVNASLQVGRRGHARDERVQTARCCRSTPPCRGSPGAAAPSCSGWA